MKAILPTLLSASLLFVDAIRVPHQHTLTSLHKTSLHTAGAGDQAMAAAQACYAGFVASIPPNFCWKKGGDAGKIPTGCPDDYHRVMAECWKDCKDGYDDVAGVCWEKCGKGRTDIGVSCYKAPFSFHTKDSYITGRITNFDDRVPCPDGMYKGGALCYRDCKKIGLVNCGIGACASSGSICGLSIAKIATDFSLSLAQSVAFVGTLGASSAATPSVSAGRTAVSKTFQSADKVALKAASKAALKSIQRMGTQEFINKMIKKAVEQVGGMISSQIITMACQQVGNQVMSKIENDDDGAAGLEWQDFDPTGISSAVGDCKKDQSNENNRIACAASVLNTISIVDPTGLTGMAAAFMQPNCDV